MRTLTLCALLAPLAALADSPFDGTWVSKEDTAVMDKKPYNFSLAKGVWKNDGPVPPVQVKADGTDQPVKGHAYYDTVAVRSTGDDSVEVTSKKAGKVAYVSTFMVDSTGKTLTRKWSDQTGTTPATGETVYERVEAGPAGSHKVSGSWRPVKVQNFSSSAKTVTYKSTPDGLSMSSGGGMSYEAKFDGKDYPVSGDPGGTEVSLKKLGSSAFEETDKRMGKVVEVDTFTVGPDGKMKVEWDDKEAHRKGSYVMEKSP